LKQIKLENPKSGSQLVLIPLKIWGLTLFLVIQVAQFYHLYDAIYDYEGIQHILARHEQGATHEAEDA
jgi:acetolactate synthase-1/2/3 large subunit